MKNKLIGVLTIVGMFLFSGCVKSVEVKKYNPPKTSSASSNVNGIPLKVKYDLSGDSTTLRGIYYHIYNANTNKLIASEWYPGKLDMKKIFKVTQNICILGTIGDKVVFTWKNGGGHADTFLSVYDFSENRTYHLLGNDEKFSILAKGNSYVLVSTNKAISLNSLKEISNTSVAGYQKLSLEYFYDGAVNRNNFGKRYTVFTPHEAYFYIKSAANTLGRLDKLMFGKYPIITKARIVPRVY